MKVKLNEKIKGIDGVKDLQNSETKAPLMLKDVIITSLLTPVEREDEKRKFERWGIFKKIRDAKSEVELTIDELKIIKTGIGLFQPPLILGQAFDLLEGKK